MAVDQMLRRFEFTVLKNRSGTDTAQVPALGTFTFFKQGATVKATTTLHPTDPPALRSLSVDWPGQFAVGDVFTIGFNGPSFTVTQVAPQSIQFLYDASSSLQVTAGTRLVGPAITPKKDILGSSAMSSPYNSDATTGRYACYIDASRFDFQVAVGGGGGTRSYVDWLGGPAVVLPSVIDARDFPNLDLAIAACADGLETTIQLAAGTYQSSGTLVVPPAKRVRLRGAGREQTRIHCADPAQDVVWVKGDGCSLEDLTVFGPGMAASNQSEFAGRGVVVGKVGAEATSPTKEFWMSNVGIRDTASWGLWCVGWDDPGGVPSSSLVILSRFERCLIEGAAKFGLLRTRRGCTTLDFNSCRFVRIPGYGAKVENCEQITFTHCVFEDSDDTQPYADLVNTTSSAFIQCWFEHHGGWVAPRASNTQRFIRIRNYCRGTTLLGCHFVRNAADPPSTVKPGNPFAIEVGEAQPDPADRARGTAIINCDFNVPGIIEGDDHIVTYNSSDVAVLASRVQATNNPPPPGLPQPQFFSPSVLEVAATTDSGQWSTMIGWAGRNRLPRFNPNDPRNQELATVPAAPGDLRFNIGLDRVEVCTASGWKGVVTQP